MGNKEELAILSYIALFTMCIVGFARNNGILMFIGGLGSAIFLISILWYSDKFKKWIYPIFIILTVIFIIILLAVAPNPELQVTPAASLLKCSDFPILVKFKPIDYTFYEDLDAEITLIDDIFMYNEVLQVNVPFLNSERHIVVSTGLLKKIGNCE